MRTAGIIQLLTLSVGFTFMLILFRFFYYDSFMYLFFTWNLFLAAIPLLISLLLIRVKQRNIQWALFAMWLLFFPNALYIITDLEHLKDRHPVPFWFDIILVFSAAFNGLVIAYISLQRIEFFLHSKLDHQKTNIILLSCLFLSSFGVYLGRYLRWNSWDILSRPSGLMNEIGRRIANPFDHPRTWGMTVLLTIFFAIFYFMVKKLPVIIKIN